MVLQFMASLYINKKKVNQDKYNTAATEVPYRKLEDKDKEVILQFENNTCRWGSG